MLRSLWMLAIPLMGLAGLSGCTGELSIGEADSDPPDAMMDVSDTMDTMDAEEPIVPVDLGEEVIVQRFVDQVPLIRRCEDVPDGQTLMTVTPDGTAWLKGDGEFRLVRPDFSETTRALPAAIREGAVFVAPYNEVEAMVIARDESDDDPGLWRLGPDPASSSSDRFYRTPTSVGVPQALCGHPDRISPTLLYGADGLTQRTDAGWTPILLGDTAVTGDVELITLDGACAGEQEQAFVRTGEGLWRLTLVDREETRDLEAAFFGRFAEDAKATRYSGGPAVLSDQVLYVRIDNQWSATIFQGGDTAAIAGSGDQLWVLAGGEFYLRDAEGEFRRGDVGNRMGVLPEKILAHPQGLWMRREDTLCHFSAGPVIQVSGVRPWEHFEDQTFEVEFSASGEFDEVNSWSIFIDEEELMTDDAPTGEIWGGSLEVGNLGWHSLRVSMQVSDGDEARTIEHSVPYRVLVSGVNWEDNIRPIVQQKCGGCHDASDERRGNAPYGVGPEFIMTREAWIDETRSMLVLDRMRGMGGQLMPPASAPSESQLSSDELTAIERWYAGGTP